MKITIEADDGTETIYDTVREFALCGLRMDAPMNPGHFSIWSGTSDYLRGQLLATVRRIQAAEKNNAKEGSGT